MHRIPQAVFLVLAGLLLAACAANEPASYDKWQVVDVLEAHGPDDPARYARVNIPPDGKVEKSAGFLSGVMDEAGADDYVAVFGPNPELTREVLTAALAGREAGSLDGVTLVYLGPEAHEEPVSEAVAPTGAALDYVVYP